MVSLRSTSTGLDWRDWVLVRQGPNGTDPDPDQDPARDPGTQNKPRYYYYGFRFLSSGLQKDQVPKYLTSYSNNEKGKKKLFAVNQGTRDEASLLPGHAAQPGRTDIRGMFSRRTRTRSRRKNEPDKARGAAI